MAGGQERILRGRIRSIQATKKITRAMELIAASRIVKAQQRVAAAVPYSEKITEVVRDLAAAGAGTDAPLLAGRDTISTTCYVAITADRGLCGGYNAGVQRATEGEVKADVVNGKQYRIVPIGRKGTGYFHFRGYELGESFTGFSDTPRLEDAKRIAAVRHRAVHELAPSTRSSSSTRGSSPPATRRSCCVRSCRCRSRRSPGAMDVRAQLGNQTEPAHQTRPMATTSTSPTRRRSSTPCCRATSRPGSTPRCSTPRRPSTPSVSGR